MANKRLRMTRCYTCKKQNVPITDNITPPREIQASFLFLLN